jgi:hypothetical protein
MGRMIPNSFQVPNFYADHVMHLLTGAELKVLIYVIRQTIGFGKDDRDISITEFCNGNDRKDCKGNPAETGTRLARGTAINAVNDLVEAGILLVVSGSGGPNKTVYAVNTNEKEINLAKFTKRQQENEAKTNQKIQKANAGRAKKRVEKLTGTDGQQQKKAVQPLNEAVQVLNEAVQATNRNSSSSVEPPAVQATSKNQFNTRTDSGSTVEPPILLHGNQVETQLETKGERPPLSCEVFTSDVFKAYEETSEDIQAALRKIFPGLGLMSGRITELTTMVLELKAPASYVQAWPTWYRTRYPGREINHFKFGDSFPELADEGLNPGAWLNGTAGPHFIAKVCGYMLNTPVPAKVSHQVQSCGHWLDDQVKLATTEEWKQRGYLPEDFQKFWKESFPALNALPLPESVPRYWAKFEAWLRKNRKQSKGKDQPVETWYKGDAVEYAGE